MAYAKKITHVDEGLANLIDQFRDKPKLRALLGIYLRQVQDLENAFCEIKEQTELSEPPIVWSGSFANLPATVDGVRLALGVDGSLTPDIGDSSHLWQAEDLTSVDLGTLATEPFNMDLSSGVTQSTDPLFGGGTRDCIANAGAGDYIGTDAGSAQRIPILQDGTEGLLAGCVIILDDQTGGDVSRSIFNQVSVGPVRGWSINCFTSTKTLQAKLYWASGASVTLTTTIDWVPGEAQLILLNIDPAAGKVKLITKDEVVEAAYADEGNYVHQAAARMGYNNIAGWDSFQGKWAQAFTLQYSGSLDAQIGQANHTRFLRYADGLDLDS